jgi:hypothetical protein
MNIKTVLIIFFSLISNYLYAQGGWDIGYKKSESITIQDTGRHVKMDFKSLKKTNPNILINLLSREDTSILILCNNDTLKVIEKREIYIDWGYYEEQYLESSDYLKDTNIKFRINESIIKDVKSDSIQFKILVSILKTKRKKSFNIGNKEFDVWVSRYNLDGVMYKKKE